MRRAAAARAAGKGGEEGEGEGGGVGVGGAALRAGTVVLEAGLVDAGYSGDWSRIGALTEAQEGLLRLAALALLAANAAMAAYVFRARAEAGLDAAGPAAKTLFVGPWGLWDYT